MASPIRKKKISATRRLLLLRVGGAVLLVLVAVLLGLALFVSSDEQQAELEGQARQQQAIKLSRQFSDMLSDYRQQLQELAAEPELGDLIRNASSSALRQKEQALARAIPSALRVRLLKTDTREVDLDSSPPLTYASLDMLRRARLGNTPVNAELHPGKEDSAHVELLQRVRTADGHLDGFIHLSLALDPVLAVAEVIEVDGAYVQLQQPVPAGQPVILASKGERTLASSAIEPTRVPVDGSSWELLVWNKGASSVTGSVGVIGSLLPLLVLGVAGLLWWLKRRWRGSAPDKEEPVYAGAIRNILDGDYPGVESLIPGMPTQGRPEPLTATAGGSGTDPGQIEAQPDDADVPTETEELSFDISGDEDAEIPAQQTASPQPDKQQEPVSMEAVPQSIFRAYDIRGIVDQTLTTEGVYQIGRAIGSEAAARDQNSVVVARDGRLSGPKLMEQLIRGLRDSGREVIDIGMVPTPVLYYATHLLETGTGVMLTGSHNPPDYNGLKIMIAGETLSGDTIQDLYRRIVEEDLSSGAGDLQQTDISADYIRRISDDIPVALGSSFKVVVDCGNGVAGHLAPQLIRSLGHDVVELFCDVDGNFPNHHPDPSQPENLEDLIRQVAETGADLGFAFDGDGDRLGVVDSRGTVIWPDRQMMLFATDVLSRNPGADIIYDVKCSRHLKASIEQASGRPLMWKTGHSLIKAKMKETAAPLAGEMSGHIFFKERWYGFDDGLYAAARLLEILTNESRAPDEVFAELPGGVATPELKMDLPEAEHAGFMDKLRASADFDKADISTIDGLRVDFDDSWGLIRASNTTPCMVLRFEADDEAALQRVQEAFRSLILSVDDSRSLPF